MATAQKLKKSNGKKTNAKPQDAKKAKAASAKAAKGTLKKVAAMAKTLTKKLTGKEAAKAAPAKAAPVKAAAAPVAPAKPVKGAKGAGPAGAPATRGRKGKDSGLPRTSLGYGRPAPVSSDNDTACRETACEGLATSAGYCRLHYIKNWRKIKRKEVILREKKLNQYIEELVAKYPDKYIEAIRQDLSSDRDFAKVIYDLELDESVDDIEAEGESMDAIVGDIKRDFEDEGEGF